MAITDTFVLPSDVLLIPVTELPERVRDKLPSKDGDIAVTRPTVRAPSQVIGANAAALLRQFENPKTIVTAVLDYSVTIGADPEQILTEALPFLKHLIQSRVLLEVDSPDSKRIEPTVKPGETFADLEIVRAVHLVEDVEVYQAHPPGQPEQLVALKIARPSHANALRDVLKREATVLGHLAGGVAPRLEHADLDAERPFLVAAWISGAPVEVVAAECHHVMAQSEDAHASAESRRRLHDLAVRIARAYAELHARGILHVDVHPNNLLTTESGDVAVIDFGYARFQDPAHPLSNGSRAGVGFYFEPECAAALLAGQGAPVASALGEQYSVAAIVYGLLTGVTHLDFSLNYEEMLRQIAGSDPRPWSARHAWPELERVVKRALDRDPESRYPSMQAFAEALASVKLAAAGDVSSAEQPSTAAHARDAAARYAVYIDRVLARLDANSELFACSIGDGSKLPTASANHGAAGIAYALLRLACRRGDPQLLALSDLWITKVATYLGEERAFYNDTLEITKDSVSEISLQHMPPGVSFVAALVGHAMAHTANEQAAIDSFIALSQKDTENLDLTLGLASVVHGCAMLLDVVRHNRNIDTRGLITLGDDALERIWRRAGAFGPVATSTELKFLGMAHGWAGLLYATLRWRQLQAQRTRTPISETLPPDFLSRLQQLADVGTRSGRGLVWPWFNGAAESGAGVMPGWCNGSAGHVFLWTLAHETLGDARYLELAQKAAFGVIAQQVYFNQLCCGAAGCAYAMLKLYRHTGDQSWLTQARQYTDRVVTVPEGPSEHPTDVDSLFKGEIGIIILLDDMNEPDRASMPLFE